MTLELKNYKRCLLLTGETKPIKDELKAVGGKWNPTLKGWIFKQSDSINVIEFAKKKGAVIAVEKAEKTEKDEGGKRARPEFREVFNKSMLEYGKLAQIPPTRQDRIVPYTVLKGKQREFVYGACTWCKGKRPDSCVLLFYFNSNSEGAETAPFTDHDAGLVVETEKKSEGGLDMKAKSALIKRPCCTECALKLLSSSKKSTKIPKAKDQEWFQIFPYFTKAKSKYLDKDCAFCSKHKVEVTAVTEDRKANICMSCAECAIQFY